MSFSERLLAAWYQGHPALALLRPLEALYRRVANGRRADFLSGRKPAYRAPVPVLVVGNITVGGTGKTPMILWMIEHCRARGLKVGVISRGYGARPPTTPWRVRAEQDAAEAGDEPLMIVRRSGVPLMIDPDRPRAVRALLAEEQLDLVLCDDGLQHYRLARDLELVLIDAARGLGNGRCLPAGPLREPAERLGEASTPCCTTAPPSDPPGAFSFTLQPSALINLASGERRGARAFPRRPGGPCPGRDRQSAAFLQDARGATLAGDSACLPGPRDLHGGRAGASARRCRWS